MERSFIIGVVVAVFTAGGLVGCSDHSGSRPGDAGVDAAADAGTDAAVDAGIDAAVDASLDSGLDAGFDASTDASTGYVSEGTYSMPVDITTILPYTGQVAPSDVSVYIVTGLVPDGVYTITLSRNDGLPYPTVPNAAGPYSGSIACGYNDTTVGGTIACAMRANGSGEAQFVVQGDDTVGGSFALDVTAGGVVNEGAPDNPVVVTTSSFSGGALIQSYYLLTGLTPGSSYQLAFQANSGPIALFTFPDNTYQSQPITCSATPGNTCTVQADSSGNIYLMTNVQNDALGVTYTISITAV